MKSSSNCSICGTWIFWITSGYSYWICFYYNNGWMFSATINSFVRSLLIWCPFSALKDPCLNSNYYFSIFFYRSYFSGKWDTSSFTNDLYNRAALSGGTEFLLDSDCTSVIFLSFGSNLASFICISYSSLLSFCSLVAVSFCFDKFFFGTGALEYWWSTRELTFKAD